MRVHPDHQRQGFGREILQTLEDRARQLDYEIAVLVTGPEQHPAIDLYTNAGYEQVKTERFGNLVGVRMAKRIRPSASAGG
jgi:ribosomal protein S18 acetylase RimI-like enzyme